MELGARLGLVSGDQAGSGVGEIEGCRSVAWCNVQMPCRVVGDCAAESGAETMERDSEVRSCWNLRSATDVISQPPPVSGFWRGSFGSVGGQVQCVLVVVACWRRLVRPRTKASQRQSPGPS
jgi:hypothetical protein